MREILFRGKDKTGAWITGSLIRDYRSEGSEYESVIRFGNSSTPVLNETVGQFTGLTDKNGVKIFEGDIGIEKGDRKFEVIFLDGSFGYWYDLRGCGKFGYSSDFEVLSSVHDN